MSANSASPSALSIAWSSRRRGSLSSFRSPASRSQPLNVFSETLHFRAAARRVTPKERMSSEAWSMSSSLISSEGARARAEF